MRAAFTKILCLLCSLILMTINVTVFADVPDRITPEDKPNESRSAVYGYVLNDYINQYGVLSNEHPMGYMSPDETVPNGVIYADIVNFENNENPYLVLFVADAAKKTAACHIWGYDTESEKAFHSATINRHYSQLDNRTGVLSIGWNEDKRYIVYKETNVDKVLYTEYFTVINGETFSYVETPAGVNESAVVSFNKYALRSEVDISYYNKALTLFFDKLKNASADSVTYPDITYSISDEDMTVLEERTKLAARLGNFDILDYDTMEDYEAALSEKCDGDTFYLISNVCTLADEMYYVRFSTNRSFYNYVLLRHTEHADKYQILKVRMDCIPLSDRELKLQKDSHLKSALLYKKAKTSILGNTSPTPTPDGESGQILNIPKVIELPKIFDERATKPIIFITAALTVFLVAGLWVYMYGHDD